MEITKPYEWDSGTFYNHTFEESKKTWDELWEFINGIDMMYEFKQFDSQELYDFMEYLENKYKFSDSNNILESIFDAVDKYEFMDYLDVKYNNSFVISEYITYSIRLIEGD